MTTEAGNCVPRLCYFRPAEQACYRQRWSREPVPLVLHGLQSFCP